MVYQASLGHLGLAGLAGHRDHQGQWAHPDRSAIVVSLDGPELKEGPVLLEDPVDLDRLEQQVLPVQLDLSAHPVYKALMDSPGHKVRQDSDHLDLRGRLEVQATRADLVRQVPLVQAELLALLDQRGSEVQDLLEPLDSQDLPEVRDHEDPLALRDTQVSRDGLVIWASRAVQEPLVIRVSVLLDGRAPLALPVRVAWLEIEVPLEHQDPQALPDRQDQEVAKLAAWWTNASTTTENVRRCALIHMIATTVPVAGAIGWRETNIPAQWQYRASSRGQTSSSWSIVRGRSAAVIRRVQIGGLYSTSSTKSSPN